MSNTASSISLIDIDSELSTQSPQDILRYALANHDNIAISFSGAEDVVLIDMAHKIRPPACTDLPFYGRSSREIWYRH